MNTSNFKFILDLQSTQSQIAIPVTRGDTARTWLISFRDGSKTYTLTDGCLAKLEIKRPTGTHIEEFCPIENHSTVRYSFLQNKNTAAVEGFHDCAIILFDEEGNIIGSPRFSMIVSDRVISIDDINLSDEDKLIVESMVTAEVSRKNAETDRINAEAARLASEKQRTQNETARQSADTERSLAEENRTKRFETLQREIHTAAATLVSPTVTVTPTENGHQVKITDHKNEHTFFLMNGKDGERGPQGPQGIQGPHGLQGPQGIQGLQGIAGKSAYELYHENGGNLTESQWLASFSQISAPLFAEVIPDNADTSKLYVLPDTHMYAYFGKSVLIEENLFDPYSTDTVANKRYSNVSLVTSVGTLTTNMLPYDYSALSQLDRNDKFYIKFTGLTAGINALYHSVGTGAYHTAINFYDSNKNELGFSYIRYISSTSTIRDILSVWDDGEGNVYLDPTKQLLSGYGGSFQFSFNDVKFVRIVINPIDSGTSITVNDYKDTKIYLCGNERTEFKNGWYDTNITYPTSATALDLVEIQNAVDAHELRIKDLEVNGSGGSGGGSSSIPAYWDHAIAKAEAKIKAFQEEGGADCVSFVWASDTHCFPNHSASGQYSTPRNVGRLAGRLMNDLNIPFFAVTGDLSADVGSADTFPDKTDIDEFFDKIVAPVGKERVLTTLGNHDGTTYSTSGDRNISKATRFNWFMRPFCNDNKRIWGGGEYYYVDYTQGKIRFIALSGNNGSTNIYRNNHYDGNQLKWLAEEALDTPNGYTVVVLSHFPSDGTSSSSSPTNSDVLMAILTAFDNKTQYSGSVDGVTISANYSSSNSIMCGIFAGHIHEDTIDTSKGFPIITVDCAGNKTSIVDRTFTNGSDQETAFDVVSINKEGRTIYLTRIGVGVDRQFGY